MTSCEEAWLLAANIWHWLRRNKNVLVPAAILLGALLLRIIFVFHLHPAEDFLYSDMGIYTARAKAILGGVFSEEQLFQPIGFSLWLAVLLKLSPDWWLFKVMQVLFSFGTVVLIWRTAHLLWGQRVGLLTLILSTMHFPFLALSGFVLAETPFTLANGVLLYVLVRGFGKESFGQSLVVGVLFGAAFYVKGSNVFFPVVWALWFLSTPGRHLPARLRPIAGFAIGTFILMLAHGAAINAYYGQWKITASTGGLNFVEGKCPWKKNLQRDGSWWHSPLFVQLGQHQEKVWDEPFTNSAYFWRQGLDCVRRDPWVLLDSVKYIYYLFFDNQLWPSAAAKYAVFNQWYGMFFSAFVFPAILVAFVALIRGPRRGQIPLLFAASIFVMVWLFKSEMRYRIPFDVAFLPMAAYGWAWLFDKYKKSDALDVSPGLEVRRDHRSENDCPKDSMAELLKKRRQTP